ncbi:hypothetical protein [Fischerella sp.]|nr:hypothetical protein [Fischerella sp.]
MQKFAFLDVLPDWSNKQEEFLAIAVSQNICLTSLSAIATGAES